MAGGRKYEVSEVEFGLPFGLGNFTFKPNDAERRAAWTIYVELITRIAVQDLGDKEGYLREALSSLYSLFEITRKVLIEAGPIVGAREGSMGYIAVSVLNRGLRPFMTKWHHRLGEWESTRASGVSIGAHERAWSEEVAMRAELVALQKDLKTYAEALAKIAGVRR